MLSLLVLTALVTAQDFESYNCDNPLDARMLAHEKCQDHPGHTITQEYTIAQTMTKQNTTGYLCEVHRTVVVDYCGHASVTKVRYKNRIGQC